ncbi:MAG: peptidase U7 [Coxiella sp. RIFCSPHIGHO2_12_FULL_42_15]|nr:MAG: peptidase U7 [Coxiella sp. RIFCSPHIGHO2_12_FULL_42_15]
MANEIEQNLTHALLKEKRRDRLWRNLRTSVWILVVLLYAYLIFSLGSDKKTPDGPYVSLVRLNGAIMPGTAFSAEKVLPTLQKAFSDKPSKGVILLINSPGGSAVQASIIHDRILALKKQFHKKVVVVGEDALASGAYLIATAADKIFVNPDTLTGSIGVIFSGFGFVDAMSKLGVTRRVYTAGGNKDRLDPFSPTNSQDIEKIKSLLDEVHQGFIQDVVASRGNLLKSDDQKELFSGDFWSGNKAVKLGLADGTANLWVVIKKEFDAKYYKDFSPRPSLLTTLFSNVNDELHLGILQNKSPVQEKAY